MPFKKSKKEIPKKIIPKTTIKHLFRRDKLSNKLDQGWKYISDSGIDKELVLMEKEV